MFQSVLSQYGTAVWNLLFLLPHNVLFRIYLFLSSLFASVFLVGCLLLCSPVPFFLLKQFPLIYCLPCFFGDPRLGLASSLPGVFFSSLYNCAAPFVPFQIYRLLLVAGICFILFYVYLPVNTGMGNRVQKSTDPGF